MADISFRQRLARLISGPVAKGAPQRRQYAAARNSRGTTGFGSSNNTSADAEIGLSLTQLRARSRQMVRDSSYAKRAKVIVVNNVIGSGIPIQAQVMTTRNELNKRVNDGIEEAWNEWCIAESCHTGGALHFYDFERAAMGQVFEAGECFVRIHRSRFGDSEIPLALELIEAERLGHDLVEPAAVVNNAEVRLGVEVDTFGRALAYWIRQRHPGDLRARAGVSDRYERVPASEILHLRLVTRWPQTRGEPWMHTVLRKLDEMNEYTGLEVQAARGSASYFATITTPEEQSPLATDEEADTQKQVMDIEPLTVQELAPGEKLDFHSPNRPNAALDPFMRHMLREVAAGIGTSYESLSRDYSQSNYSSSRLALLDDRDLWRMLQQWWVRSFRAPLHKQWLQAGVLSGAIEEIAPQAYALDACRYECVKFKLRGWQWVDPTKEVEAYKEARRAGFISTSDIIDQTAGGQDVDDVIASIQIEDEKFEAAGIRRDTEVPAPTDAMPAEPAEGADVEAPADTSTPAEDDASGEPADTGRVFALKR